MKLILENWRKYLAEAHDKEPHLDPPPSLINVPGRDFPVSTPDEMPWDLSYIPPHYLRDDADFPPLVEQAKQMTLEYLRSPEFKRRLLDKIPAAIDSMEWAAHIDDEMQILEKNLHEVPFFLSWLPKQMRASQAYYSPKPEPHLVYNILV